MCENEGWYLLAYSIRSTFDARVPESVYIRFGGECCVDFLWYEYTLGCNLCQRRSSPRSPNLPVSRDVLGGIFRP